MMLVQINLLGKHELCHVGSEHFIEHSFKDMLRVCDCFHFSLSHVILTLLKGHCVCET